VPSGNPKPRPPRRLLHPRRHKTQKPTPPIRVESTPFKKMSLRASQSDAWQSQKCLALQFLACVLFSYTLLASRGHVDYQIDQVHQPCFFKEAVLIISLFSNANTQSSCVSFSQTTGRKSHLSFLPPGSNANSSSLSFRILMPQLPFPRLVCRSLVKYPFRVAVGT